MNTLRYLAHRIALRAELMWLWLEEAALAHHETQFVGTAAEDLAEVQERQREIRAELTEPNTWSRQ